MITIMQKNYSADSRYCTRFMILLSIMILSKDAYACVTTIVNNSSSAIQVADHTNKKKHPDRAKVPHFIIQPGKSRRIGMPHEHADFTIFTKTANKQAFEPTYHVLQNECAADGNPKLSISDMEFNTGDAPFFTIEKLKETQSVSSNTAFMATLKKPDVYKTEKQGGCSACQMK